MAILSKGHTFANADTVTSTKLNNLVDNATFAAGCVDGVSTTLVGGQIIVRDGGLLPAKLSTGAPTWTSGGNVNMTGNVTADGTLATGGSISSSSFIQSFIGFQSNGYLNVDGDSTFTGEIISPAILATGRTVKMVTASASPNAISFGWNAPDLLVKIDNTNWKVTLTSVP
jgi:hypothetical protein